VGLVRKKIKKSPDVSYSQSDDIFTSELRHGSGLLTGSGQTEKPTGGCKAMIPSSTEWG